MVKKNLTGIDIGCDSIKAIRLKGIKDSEISSIFYKKIGCERHDGDIFDDRTRQGLKDVAKVGGLSQSACASIIMDPSISFINISIPPMPKDEITQAVRFEVKKQLTFSADEAVIDYFIKDRQTERSPMITLTAIALKKEGVYKHIDFLKSAGFKPAAVEINAIPLAAAFDFNYSWDPNKKTALLDIGASKSTLVIVKDKTIRFYREIPVCGAFFTNIFRESYGLSFEEADEKKINMLGREEGKEKLFADIVGNEQLQDLFEQFVLEIQRSFDYYQAKYREGPVSDIILSGGGALMQNIDRYFTETLGIDVSIDNPFKKLYFSNKFDEDRYSAISPIFTAAVGLALRKA